MAASDAKVSDARKPHHEANAEACQKNAEAAMHHEASRMRPEERRELLSKYCPDTGSKFLQPMELVDSKHPTTDQSSKPGVKRNADGGTTETTINAEGTRSEVTKNQYHEMQRSVITKKDGSVTEFEAKPNGFVATERKPDGSFVKNEMDEKGMTVTHHNPDGKGGFTETTERPDHTKTVHQQDKSGEYTESNYKDGKLQSESRHSADGTALPLDAVKGNDKSKVADPTDPVSLASGYSLDASKIVQSSRDASFYRNTGRMVLGGVILTAKDEGSPIGDALLKGYNSAGSRVAGRVFGPVMLGVQGLGGVAKLAHGDNEGAHDIVRAAISWTATGAVGLLGVEGGPLDPLIAGGAGAAAGQTYDELRGLYTDVRDHKPITYDDAKKKYDSSWFHRLMEPREDNWVN